MVKVLKIKFYHLFLFHTTSELNPFCWYSDMCVCAQTVQNFVTLSLTIIIMASLNFFGSSGKTKNILTRCKNISAKVFKCNVT